MFTVLNDRSVIHIYGQDVQKFLQGLVTNDIVKQNFSYNYLLNNKGRYLFDCFIFQQDHKFYWIDLPKSQLFDFLSLLHLYKLTADVVIKDVSDQFCVTYSIENNLKNIIYSFRDPRFNMLGFRSVCAKKDIKSTDQAIKNLYLEDKYKYSIPDGVVDLKYNQSIPVEYGADQLNAISYTKGCYIGQELISRIKHQGIIRKKIYQLVLNNHNNDIFKNTDLLDKTGNKIGILCSIYQGLAIALLRKESYLNLEEKNTTIGKCRVSILIPEWYNE